MKKKKKKQEKKRRGIYFLGMLISADVFFFVLLINRIYFGYGWGPAYAAEKTSDLPTPSPYPQRRIDSNCVLHSFVQLSQTVLLFSSKGRMKAKYILSSALLCVYWKFKCSKRFILHAPCCLCNFIDMLSPVTSARSVYGEHHENTPI